MTGTSASQPFIEFSGTASQVRQAFGTPIHRFVVNGQQHYANVSDPTIPAALTPVVAGIDSLHNFQKQAQNVPLGTYSFASRRLLSPAYTLGGGQRDERIPCCALRLRNHLRFTSPVKRHAGTNQRHGRDHRDRWPQ